MLARLRSRRPSHATVVAYLALFVALGGTGAYAANTVFSADIVDGEVKNPDIAAGAVSPIKLAAGAVTTEKIAGGAVTTDKVRNENLVGADVLNNSLKGVDIDESTLTSIGGGGPAGGDLTGTYPNPLIAPGSVTAEKIADGAVGSAQLADIAIYESSESIPPNGGVGGVIQNCPSGPVIGGGAEFAFRSGDVSASYPISSIEWIAEGQNNGTVAQDLTVYAICLEG